MMIYSALTTILKHYPSQTGGVQRLELEKKLLECNQINQAKPHWKL